MPIWKKVKNTKISQLVNDHLHSSQRRRDGSSLVVETGFPTSLIDLFIKNREKLQKSSHKKRVIAKPSFEIVPPISNNVNNQVIEACPTPYPSPLASPSRVILASPVPAAMHINPIPHSVFNEIVAVQDSDFVGEKLKRGVDANGVFLAVLKLFLVVILALGTKRLTVGITLSAFLLFFLDCVGERVSGSLKLCFEAKGVLCRILRFNKDDSSSYVKRFASRFPIQEIQTVDRKDCLVNRVEEVRLENEIVDGSGFEGRCGSVGTELKEVVMEKEEFMCGVEEFKRRKRRDKINLKMKKFVPKKLQISRKEEHHPEIPQIVSEDNVALSEELKVDQCKDEREAQGNSRLVTSGRYKEEDPLNATCLLGGLSNVNEESATRREEEVKETESGLDWRYSVLILIILVGLVGGRAFALLLTLSSWCLLLKFGEFLCWPMNPSVVTFH